MSKENYTVEELKLSDKKYPANMSSPHFLKCAEENKKRLENFPVLKRAIEEYIVNDGLATVPGYIPNLIYYIKLLNLDEPSFFDWDEHDTEEFYSWGHNSRYVHVLQPNVYCNFNDYLERILNYLELSKIKEPEIYKEEL